MSFIDCLLGLFLLEEVFPSEVGLLVYLVVCDFPRVLDPAHALLSVARMRVFSWLCLSRLTLELRLRLGVCKPSFIRSPLLVSDS
jgi:hypothetical protein